MLSNVPSLVCDETLLANCLGSIRELEIIDTMKDNVKYIGSEDFALIAERVPACYVVIGAGINEESRKIAQHNPKIVFNEDSLPVATAIYVKVATDWLNR